MAIGTSNEKKIERFQAGTPRLNPARTKCLLVGVSNFSLNQALPGVLNDIANLKRTMLSPIMGLNEDNILVMLNPQSEHLLEKVRELAKDETLENIFLYFSGTGAVSGEGVLELAFYPGEEKENAYDLLPVTALDDALGDTKANVVLILDCCHSQTAFLHFYLDNFFILTASGMDEYTYEQVIEGEVRGVFTHYLVKVLNEGLENGKPWLSLVDVYAAVREHVAAAPETHISEPKMMATNMVPLLEFARNKGNAPKQEQPKAPTTSVFVLKNLVAEGERDKVLNLMMEATKDTVDLLNGIVTLKASNTDFDNKVTLGLYLEQEAVVFKNRLIQSIVIMIDSCRQQGVFSA